MKRHGQIAVVDVGFSIATADRLVDFNASVWNEHAMSGFRCAAIELTECAAGAHIITPAEISTTIRVRFMHAQAIDARVNGTGVIVVAVFVAFADPGHKAILFAVALVLTGSALPIPTFCTDEAEAFRATTGITHAIGIGGVTVDRNFFAICDWHQTWATQIILAHVPVTL